MVFRDIQTSHYKFTPLHIAALSDIENVVTSVLIYKGASIEAKNALNQTALHIAAQNGFTETVITLLFEGRLDFSLSGNTSINSRVALLNKKSRIITSLSGST